MTSTTGTCVKCDGRGHIGAFSHIVGGRCFMCAGSGKIEIKRAAQSATGPAKASRTVSTAAGEATVMRHGDGFVAYFAGGAVYFMVVAGRVVDALLSDGLRGEARYVAALQGALRA